MSSPHKHIKRINRLVKTGQTTPYIAGDDGTLQKGNASPGVRFMVSGGLVYDYHTRLCWPQDIRALSLATVTNWVLSRTICNDYAGGGFTDWYMPNVNEMLSILDYEDGLFNDIFTHDASYLITWTSTTHPLETTSAIIISAASNTPLYRKAKTDATTTYVIPVRSF